MKDAKPDALQIKADHDVVLVQGRNEDGKSYAVLRSRNGKLEAGSIAPLEHGKTISGDVVQLTPRGNSKVLFDVKVNVSTTSSPQPITLSDSLSTNGPAKVANASYRKGWDVVFSKRPRKVADTDLN